MVTIVNDALYVNMVNIHILKQIPQRFVNFNTMVVAISSTNCSNIITVGYIKYILPNAINVLLY